MTLFSQLIHVTPVSTCFCRSLPHLMQKWPEAFGYLSWSHDLNVCQCRTPSMQKIPIWGRNAIFQFMLIFIAKSIKVQQPFPLHMGPRQWIKTSFLSGSPDDRSKVFTLFHPTCSLLSPFSIFKLPSIWNSLHSSGFLCFLTCHHKEKFHMIQAAPEEWK